MRPSSPLPLGLVAAALALVAPLLAQAAAADAPAAPAPVRVASADAAAPAPVRLTSADAAAPAPVDGALAPAPGDTPPDAPGSRTQRVVLLQEGTPMGDVERAYQLTVPTAGAGLRPLVLALHGRQQGIDSLRRVSGLEALGDTEGFVSAFPVGWAGVWNAGTCCTSGAAPAMPDVEFLDQVVADVSSRTPVDLARVHVVGYSNGGMMAYRYACQRSAAVAGIGVVSGSMASSPDYADSGPQRCRPASPVSVVAVHGSKDATVPYEGGRVGGTQAGSAAPVRAGVDQSAVAASCRQARSYRVGTSIRFDYTGCQDGAAVRLVRLQGHGHGWTRDSRRYGYDTTAGIWGFLRDRKVAGGSPAS